MTVARNTYLVIASYLRQKIQAGHYTKELPTLGEIAQTFGVARGVAMRAVYLLRDEGLVDVVQGDGLYVAGSRGRDLTECLTELHAKLTDGAVFPSEKELCQRFEVSRPKLRMVLARLEGRGLLGWHGQRRIVLALPRNNDKGSA